MKVIELKTHETVYVLSVCDSNNIPVKYVSSTTSFSPEEIEIIGEDD